MGLITDIDPLALALAPPADESDQQRVQRLQEEERARRVSEEIDEQLRKEGAALKKQKKPIKVLPRGAPATRAAQEVAPAAASGFLVRETVQYSTDDARSALYRGVSQAGNGGDYGSVNVPGVAADGKSTTLKNFQLAYAANAWAEERLAWKTVIQLNLIRHVTIILEHLSQDMNASTSEESGSDSDEPARPSRSSSASSLPLRFTEKHRLLKLRLAPLRSVQDDLQARLGASDWPAPAPGSEPRSKMQDFFVRSNAGWKSSLRPGKRSPERSRRKQDEDNETGEVLTGCAEDIKALWADDVIQDMLRRRKLRLDLLPGFFLHERDVDRIAKRDYTPSDDDVVRSRLRTLGVQEHRIHFETGPAAGTEWCLYDVGGSRTQRAAWFPYFDDCDAIIFLAPISCFDEKLAEDRRVNRLEDSYQLWKMICANKLLSKAQIILFLNKCDLLDKKLKSGVRVRDFVPSFGDRKNDLQTVAQYFAQHFKEIAKSHASALRPFRVHLTSVVDTKATALTLGIVGESILRTQLRDADLL